MSSETLQLRLDLIQAQLKWLEREVAFLRREIAHTERPTNLARTFADLRGVWAGILVNEKDFQAARIKLPENL